MDTVPSPDELLCADFIQAEIEPNRRTPSEVGTNRVIQPPWR